MNITTKLIWVGHRHDTFVDVQFSPFKLLRKYYSMNFIEMAEAKQSTFKFMLKPKPLFTQPASHHIQLGVRLTCTHTCWVRYELSFAKLFAILCSAQRLPVASCCLATCYSRKFSANIKIKSNLKKLYFQLVNSVHFHVWMLNAQRSYSMLDGRLDVGWTTQCWMNITLLHQHSVVAVRYSAKSCDVDVGIQFSHPKNSCS